MISDAEIKAGIAIHPDVNIANIDLIFHDKAIATVVLASENYPNTPILGRELIGYNSRIDEGQIRGLIHFSGTNMGTNGNVISSGGRVLSATGMAPSIIEAIEKLNALGAVDQFELNKSNVKSEALDLLLAVYEIMSTYGKTNFEQGGIIVASNDNLNHGEICLEIKKRHLIRTTKLD